MTRLQALLISNSSFAIDIKYSLVWNYGIFLIDIPRRLGCNEALGAATRCLMAAYGSFCAGKQEATPSILSKFSVAWNALRRCLADPPLAHTSETLCAMMILMTAQVT